MIIEKKAINKSNYLNPVYFYESARKAFKDVLVGFNQKGNCTLVLPGYIGYSSREGSGIYDPVIESEIRHVFYKMDQSLNIDIDDFENILNSIEGKIIVLLVHYFGFVDENIERVVKLCREKKAIIIEDAAHAFFTDVVDHACGRWGDYVIYSLHKMFPFEHGGMLKMNCNREDIIITGTKNSQCNIYDYDFCKIAEKRKKNAFVWQNLIKENKYVKPLRNVDNNTTPQTFPVIIKTEDRDKLYFRLNEQGFGAVSLYHEMIKNIYDLNLEDAIWLSKHIINLPVHQDVSEEEIRQMADEFAKILDWVNIPIF